MAEIQSLKDLITEAFSAVRLGDGIGLWQAQGIDDYADAAEIARLRARDEKINWQAIPIDDLNYCYSSLSFFDSLGMRFCLPAFLIAELDGTFEHSVIFTLASESLREEQFGALSMGQRSAVCAFLRHCMTDPEYEFDLEDIRSSLEQYWAKI